MSEAVIPNLERGKKLVLVLTMINTVLAAVIAGLGSDAGIRAAQANRDSQYYAVLTSGELFRSGQQSTYDLATMAEVLTYEQESLVMQFTSLDQQQKGNTAGAAASDLQGAVAQARADKVKAFSIFYTDPRYAPKTADGLPNPEKYVQDGSAEANALLVKQNAASDVYHRWNDKSDSYTAVFSVLAIAFFLLGLAQTVEPRLRLLFTGFALAVMLLAGLWTLGISLG